MRGLKTVLELAHAFTVLGFLTLITFLQLRYPRLEIAAGILWIYVSLVIFSQVDVGFALLGLIPGLYFLFKGAIDNIPQIELGI